MRATAAGGSRPSQSQLSSLFQTQPHVTGLKMESEEKRPRNLKLPTRGVLPLASGAQLPALVPWAQPAALFPNTAALISFAL